MSKQQRRRRRKNTSRWSNWLRNLKRTPETASHHSDFMEPLEPRVLLSSVIGHESAMVDIGNGIFSSTEFTDDPPLQNQIALGFGNFGRTYTNTFSDGGDGDPTNVGNEIRTIYASKYSLGVRRFTGPSPTDPGDGIFGTADDFLQSHNGIHHDPDGLPDDQGQFETIDVAVIAALRLTVTDITGTLFTASVDDARLGIFATPNPGGSILTAFNVNDPETWDVAGTPLQIDGLALGVFNLTDPIELTTGSLGANIGTLPASEVNVSAANSDLGQSAQGIFLFEEDESVTNLFTNNNLPDDAIGDGLVVFSTQEQENPTAVFNAADQTILNEIFQWGLGQDFANWGSGDLTDYDPVGQAGLDTQNRVDANANPTVIIGEVEVDAKITITPDDTNEVGDDHTFTVTVWEDDGTGTDVDGEMGFFDRAAGETVEVTLDGIFGAVPDLIGPI